MEYRKLGETELMCSVIGFGGFSIGGTDWQGTSEKDSEAALKTAFDLGINFYDTSNAYGWGQSEELIGKILAKHRKDIIIATKGGVVLDNKDFSEKNFTTPFLRKSLEDSLCRLKTDHIDLYQLHSPSAEDLNDETMRFMEDIVKEGKACYVGVSISDDASAFKSLEIENCASLQIYFNMLEQRLKKSLFPQAVRHNIGLIGRVPLYSGFLSGLYSKDVVFESKDHRSAWDKDRVRALLMKVDRLKALFGDGSKALALYALAYVLHHKEISLVIPGAKNSRQVRENVKSVDLKLTQEQITAIEEISNG